MGTTKALINTHELILGKAAGRPMNCGEYKGRPIVWQQQSARQFVRKVRIQCITTRLRANVNIMQPIAILFWEEIFRWLARAERGR